MGEMEWEVERRFKREGPYAYLWLIHADVWQKPTQYCKAIIHQLKIKKFLKKSPGEGNGNPLQYSHLENLIDRGARKATVHGVTKNQTWLRDLAHTYETILLCFHSFPILHPNCISVSASGESNLWQRFKLWIIRMPHQINEYPFSHCKPKRSLPVS